jgi:hypothetical protein
MGSGRSQSKHSSVRWPLPPGGSDRVKGLLHLGQWERVEVLANQALGPDRFLFKWEIRDWMAPMERFIF